MIYLIGGMVIVIALLSFYADSQRSAKLTAEARVEACGAKLETQTEAVTALETEGKRKQKEAAQALAKAEGKAKVWTDNATRLQAVLTNRKPTDAKDCKSAWEELRK